MKAAELKDIAVERVRSASGAPRPRMQSTSGLGMPGAASNDAEPDVSISRPA